MKKILIFTASIALLAGGLAACQKTEPQTQAAPAQPGRGCLAITADHPYSLKDMRFDEAAQALAHATGCFILSSLLIVSSTGTPSLGNSFSY